MKDKKIGALIIQETKRQKATINLIASENLISKDIMEALGSVFGNKYAEGYPGKRYYGGNSFVDKLETLCQKRALELFGLSENEWAANVQALSGSPANIAILSALVKVGEKVMGMKLSDGGHLTHGHEASLSGKWWTPLHFGVDPETETIDYDALRELAIKEKPKVMIAGFTAYPRVVDWAKFEQIAHTCGAILVTDISHVSGLIAGGVYPSPFPHADVVMTTTHKTLRGPRGALIFSRKDHRGIPEKIDKAVFPGLQGGPHMNQIAAVAVALKEAKQPAFKTYAKQVIKNGQAFAKALTDLGWRLISGGTDSHLLLVDTWMDGKGISGGEACARLEKEGIIVNKNTIPGDMRSPNDPSGIRLGTPFQTSRGWKTKDFVRLAKKIDTILRS
jgi:glycine hydroxymethyltransferase